MRQIRSQDLKPGMVFREGLFSQYGTKMLAGGIPLSAEMCRTLRRSKQDVFFLAMTAAELAEAGLIRVTTAPATGANSPAILVTEGGVPALGRGQTVEEHHTDAFAGGAFEFAAGAPESDSLLFDSGRPSREILRAHASLRKMAEAVVRRRSEIWDQLDRSVKGNVAPLLKEPPPPEGEGQTIAFPTLADPVAYRAARVSVQRRILGLLLAGLPVDARTPLQLVDELIDRLLREPEHYAQVALQTPRRADYLPDHCLTVAALSVGVAARLGWSRWDVRAAGLAGLFADTGMALVSSEIRKAERRLSEVEINRVRRHPVYSVVLLEEVRDLPDPVRLAVYQHHERCDRSGYPGALRAEQIHDFAKVVAVADEYAAATAARAYRPTVQPFSAMERMIESASEGRVERRFVRALVEVCGLFPVGSFVRLSDETVAEIVGISDAAKPDRPIVRRWSNGPMGDPQDLSGIEPWELHVLQAVEVPEEERHARRTRRAA